MARWETLVEATIDSIRLDPSNKKVFLDLTSAWEDRGRMRISSSGVDDFVLNDMRLSNVIDRVTVVDAERAMNNEAVVLRRLFFLMRGREPSAGELEWGELRERLACIQSGRLSLVEIEPVYGASIIILAETVSLDPIT